MSKSKISIILGIIAGFIILILIADGNKKSKKIKELQKEIDENENFTKKIKEQLKRILETNKDLDPSVSKELTEISALIEIQQETKAMLALVKIIESLLVKIYKGDPRLKEIATKNKRKKPAFADYLELAKERGVIDKENYHLISVAKSIRDKEAHDIDSPKEKSRILASFISGVATVLVLCNLAKSITKS